MAKLKFDYSRLRGLMRERGETLETLAKKTGISVGTLSNHMARGTGFTMDQVFIINAALCSDLTKVTDLFFDVRL